MRRVRATCRLGWSLLFSLLALACLLPSPGWANPPPLKRGDGVLSPVLKTLASGAVRSLPVGRQARLAGVAGSGPGSLLRRGDSLLVYLRFDHGAVAALPELREAGAQVLAASGRDQRVTVAVPQSQLTDLPNLPGIASAAAARAPVLRAFEPCEGGSVVSEGVEQLNVPPARLAPYHDEGEGITVGVLSDSLHQATEAVTGGPIATKEPQDAVSLDLPGKANTCPGQESPVQDLEDDLHLFGESPFDEGRAMLQIVHDVAPKAELAFNSAFNGEQAFAEGIENLAKPLNQGGAGAKVIVDDVAYFEEPFFQDGPVGAAVDKVAEAGVTYLSAAGNDNLFDAEGNEIASWEAPEFRDSGSCPPKVAALPSFNGSHCMDFNPGPGTDRTFGIKVEPEEELTIDLQWAEPWGGVETNLDAVLLNAQGKLLTGSAENNIAGSQQPLEIVQWLNESQSTQTVQLAINKFAGPGDAPLKFIFLQNGGGVSGTEYPKSGGGDVVGPSIYGHAGAAGAIAVGAVRFNNSTKPEGYSSRGPATHYYGPVEAAGPAPELPGAPEVLSGPQLAATDCGRTTFFAVEPKSEPGAWRFCGTSAAAPHAAGVAALLLADEPGATPGEVREALSSSAAAVGESDRCAVGGGLVETVGALEAIELGAPFPPTGSCEPPGSAGPVFVAAGDWGAEEPTAPPAPSSSSTTTPTGPAATPAPSESVAPSSAATSSPPATRFVRHPRRVVRSRRLWRRVGFRFGSDQEGVSFRCRIDRGRWHRCRARPALRFKPGRHVVRAEAVSSAGVADPTPARFRFRVERVRVR